MCVLLLLLLFEKVGGRVAREGKETIFVQKKNIFQIPYTINPSECVTTAIQD